MVKRWKALLVGLAILVAAVPVVAAAPEALSIIINGYPMSGKALWYKGKIYVPLEDLAMSTGGGYQFDEKSGVATATVGGPRVQGTPAAAPGPQAGGRPYLRVVWERKYIGGANARVVATVKNVGESPAQNLEAICIFKDDTLNELSAVTRGVGVLRPGESRTLEFALYDTSVPGGYPSYGYGPGGYYYYPSGVGVPGSTGDKILVDGQWTRIYYELKFNYQ